MDPVCIRRLRSGGLITNYHCTSKCRHCLYKCSPAREKDYIERDEAVNIMQKMISLGCNSIHIGGGEPFLNIEKIMDVADAARETGMHIEYVETNSSWYTDQEKTKRVLDRLIAHGIGQLLISISPFHNEFIPFFKTKGLIMACREAGMGIFPWIADFYPEADAFNDRTTHGLAEYQKQYGRNYLRNIPDRYWIHLGGRAAETFSNELPLSPLENILTSGPCREPEETSHFHIDLYGNYIPGLCAGFVVDMEDLGRELDPSGYPLLTLLHSGGIRDFLSFARNEYGFHPKNNYLNKCHLCNDIRSHLKKQNGSGFTELGPNGYYD